MFLLHPNDYTCPHKQTHTCKQTTLYACVSEQSYSWEQTGKVMEFEILHCLENITPFLNFQLSFSSSCYKACVYFYLLLPLSLTQPVRVCFGLSSAVTERHFENWHEVRTLEAVSSLQHKSSFLPQHALPLSACLPSSVIVFIGQGWEARGRGRRSPAVFWRCENIGP